MRPKIDEKAMVAVAERHVREARIGQPQLLGGVSVWTTSKFLRRLAHMMRRAAFSRQHRLKVLRRCKSLPSKAPTWSVAFLLYDARYVDGVTTVTVKLDESGSVLGMEIFSRGGLPASHPTG